MTRGDSGARIAVTGDVTMDWNLFRTRRSRALAGNWDDTTESVCQPGGAALVGALIEGIGQQLRHDGLADVEVCPVTEFGEGVAPGDARFQRSYALWSRFPIRGHSSGRATVWRVEEFLGLEPRPAEPGPVISDVAERGNQSVLGADADVIVIDDADLGFRDNPASWPEALTAGRGGARPWIIVKMTRPIAQGALWDRLVDDWADRVIVVMTINDLRLSEVRVSRELSWERTAQDLVRELLQNEQVSALSRCAHVVVSLQSDGVLLLSHANGASGSAGPDARLVFDPTVIEGMWGSDYPGAMIGQTVVLTAAIARQLMLASAAPDLGHGLQRGLAAMRALHVEGYGEHDPERQGPQLGFPVERMVTELAREDEQFAEARVPTPAGNARRSSKPADPGAQFWTILEDRYRARLGDLGQQIVLQGAEAVLEDVPLGRFGRLLTVDRHEIESYRSIRSLIVEYSRAPHPGRPLSIGVFGPPGSGKSFGVVQVATSALPDQIASLTFNLSQFTEAAELNDALHQVRDVSLAGKLPLVFWDEFDTEHDNQKLGWLRRFLVPMQDGAFQESQISHPIGPAIFVFAGGTCERMDQFGASLGEDRFRDVKGPDFVSRLRGYVDILGPNPRPSPEADPYYVIRRAILLRAMLRREQEQLFHHEGGKRVLNMDPAVLHAFLETRQYRHGARSMESLLSMSLLAGKQQFERSSLPAEAQLSLHVDAEDFLALVR